MGKGIYWLMIARGIKAMLQTPVFVKEAAV